jgi:hypothetical protein
MSSRVREVFQAITLRKMVVFQTVYQRAVARFLSAVVMFRIDAGKYITRQTRLGSKLREDRMEEFPAVLLVVVVKVAIEISHNDQAFLALHHDIFNYPRTATI